MKKRQIIVPALLAIAMSGSLIAGATYSLFTSESKHDITVSSGKISLESKIDSTLALTSMGHECLDGYFENGGSASINENILSLENITPGDAVAFKINLRNFSTVKAKYKVSLRCKSGAELFDSLVITSDNEKDWTDLPVDENPNNPKTKVVNVKVELPKETGNDYQGLNSEIVINVEAVQANAEGYNPTNPELNKAEDDLTAVRMNKILKVAKPNTMKAAVEALRPTYDLENITTKHPETNFVYNLKDNKVSAVLREDLITAIADANNWVVVKNEEELNTLTERYSVYLANHFVENKDNILTVTNGIDMGENNEEYTIKYTGAGAKKDLLFNTAGANNNLEITAYESGENSDTIKHYGEVGKVSLINAGSHSYHEFGVSAYVELTKGRLVAEDKARIEVVYAKGVDLVVSKVDTATITNALTVSSTNANGNVSLKTTTETEIQNAANDALKEAKSKVVKVTKADGSSDMLKMDEFRAEWNKGTYYNLANPATVELTDNVDLSNYPQWGPIGSWQYPFNGTFDGKGFTIDKLKGIKGQGLDTNGNTIGKGEAYALFGVVGGADCTIKNLSLTNVNISIPDDGNHVAALVSYAPNNKKFGSDGNTFLPEGATQYPESNTMGEHNLTIENVNVGSATDESTIVGNAHVAGFVGKYYSSGALTIKNCTNYASVTANGNVGGILGFSSNGSSKITFDHVINNGTIVGGDAVGGIASYVDGAETSFINCTNKGNVTNSLKKSGAAGILTYVQSTVNNLIFDNCSNEGTITCEGSNVNIGGIYSGNYGAAVCNATVHFKNVIQNTGKLIGVEGTRIGDIIGCFYFDDNPYGTIKNISEIPTINIKELDPSIKFGMTNSVNRGQGDTTVSIVIDNQQ